MVKIPLQGTAGSGFGRPLDGLSADERAQQVIYKAWEASSKKKRIALAHKALSTSKNCADAYNLLAEYEEDLYRATELYRQGMEAGERALGKKFHKYEGGFWGFIETRPYMRARAGLAQCLWEDGKKEEAVAHYRKMLHLNPNDNQGIRDILASCLLEMNLHDELEVLLKRYKNDSSAVWTYSRALLAFRKSGASAEARKLALAAVKCNKHVPAFLLGTRKIPEHLPDFIGMGDKNEAISYAGDNLACWKATPGALEWLSSFSTASA
jgi:tetratricopeptide (TPR) repeat protein